MTHRNRFAAGHRPLHLPAGFALSGGTEPQKNIVTGGVREIRTFPASAPIEHDKVPDIDRCSECWNGLGPHGTSCEHEPFPGQSKPTVEIGPALTASLIHGALVQWGDGTTELDQVAQVIAGAIRLEAERIAERERDKVLLAVRQLNEVVTVLVGALERDAVQRATPGAEAA